MKHERALAYVAFGIVCLVWGTTYLAIRVAIETIPTFLLAGVRFTSAGLILLVACRLAGQRIPGRLSEWANLALVGFLLVSVANVAVVWAEHYMTSGFAALLVAGAPFWMAGMEAVRAEGERVRGRKVVGMIVGFFGVAILVAPDLRPSAFDGKFLLAFLALQVGSVAWNFGSIRSKYHPVQAHPLVAAAIQMITGGAIVTVIGLAAGEAEQFHFSARSLTAFLYLVVFGSIVAYGAYVYVLSKLPTSTSSLYAYVNPAVAVVLGWAILGEPLGWRAVVSMTVIFAGVALVQTAKGPQSRPAVVVPIEEALPVAARRRA